MLTIRLQRVGKKNQPVFRIVLAEKHRAAKKQIVELLGHYNPRTKEFGIKDEARLKYWIEQHVEISPTVHNLLIDKGILTGQKVKAWRPKAKSSDLPAEASAQAGASEKEENTKSQEVKPAESPTETKSEEKAEETKAEPAKTEKTEAPSEQ